MAEQIPVKLNDEGTLAEFQSGDTIDPQFLGGGAGGSGPIQIHADMFDYPNNSDWAVATGAPINKDIEFNGKKNRVFDDTNEEGIGFTLFIPATATGMTLSFRHKAVSAPTGSRTVGCKLYNREDADDTAGTAWNTGNALPDFDVPLNVNVQYTDIAIDFNTYGITAGNLTQFELTRVAPQAGTNLEGDWAIRAISVEWT